MEIYEKYPELYLKWRNTLTKGSIIKETNFIIKCLENSKKPIKTIIDIGGGIGLYANELQKKGYDVTIYDRSKKSLRLSKKSNSKLKVKSGTFENIKLKEKYDAAICMWTTFTYIFDDSGRKSFYDWLSKHIKHLIILDEGNFYQYPKKYYNKYESKNKEYKTKIIRTWVMKKNVRQSVFENHFINLKNKTKKIVIDHELMYFLSPNQIKKLIGKSWRLDNVFGDYNIRNKYNKEKSSRLIMLFKPSDK